MAILHTIIIGSATDILPFLMGLYFWRDLAGYLKILWIFFMFTVLCDVIFIYLAFHKMHNLWLLNVFSQVEYGVWIYVFSCWQKKETSKKVFRFSLPLFPFIWIGFKVSGVSIGELYYYFSTIESVILVAVSVYTLYSLNSDPFWFCLCMMSLYMPNVPYAPEQQAML